MDKTYRVILLSVDTMDWPTIMHFEKSISSLINQHDIDIKYTVNSSIVALFERSDEEEAGFIASVKNSCEEVVIEKII